MSAAGSSAINGASRWLAARAPPAPREAASARAKGRRARMSVSHAEQRGVAPRDEPAPFRAVRRAGGFGSACDRRPRRRSEWDLCPYGTAEDPNMTMKDSVLALGVSLAAFGWAGAAGAEAPRDCKGLRVIGLTVDQRMV